jgi:hypothetical protein
MIKDLEKKWDDQHRGNVAAWDLWCSAKEAFNAAEMDAANTAADAAAQKTRAEKLSKSPGPARTQWSPWRRRSSCTPLRQSA